ncbi:serologically defined colon cancer antigen 8 homolog [Rhincodon typus]|uniref:serologically defined colon cancer antigen 8 homolog n=1 Tax=Rhincodon typus TaxID=259920 RepID=UPI00202F5BBA|nr:serologically defined colon cancer antigen 8 homolog [Rhincodon typus]
MKASCESNIEDDLETYLKGLRERANESIQKLKCTLEEKNQAESSEPSSLADTVQTNSVSPSERRQCHSPVAWQELKHSHAVNELRALLRHQETEQRPSSAAATSAHPMMKETRRDFYKEIKNNMQISHSWGETTLNKLFRGSEEITLLDKLLPPDK